MAADLDLLFQPAHVLVRRLRDGDLAPIELLDQCLDRIGEVNPTLNAFVSLRVDEARAEAKAIGDALARGEAAGPLAGLPFGVKELEDVKGLPSTHGSIPWKDHYPEEDSVQVARLKAAGAIVVGKTNAPEFGSTGFTKNLVYGVTRNPWNPERTPGGSSGGSAAALASGMVPLTTGSDGGGSIRIPACYVGAFGLKPTFGRIPNGPLPMLNFSDTTVMGPITRTVRDAALYMDCVVGDHWSDPDSLPHPGYSYEKQLDRLPERLKIAWSPTFGHARVEPDVLAVASAAKDAFAELGHTVEEIDDVFPRTGMAWARLSGLELFSKIYDVLADRPDDFGRAFARGIQMAGQTRGEHLGEIYRLRAELNAAVYAVFARYDLLLSPQLPTEAFAAKGPPPETIAGERVKEVTDAVAFTFPFNFTGLPAACVRAGFSKNDLPVGLQIVAPRHRDDLVLQAAYAYEQARPWNDRWPREIG